VEARPLSDLHGALMGMIVLPYLGPAAADRELRRRAPKRPKRPVPRVGDALEGLEMRLTYRTLRVLSVLAQRPGASNRAVAERAGVSDQGQVSKLLMRLSNLGLIENSGDGHTKGGPNAWRLTPRGQDVENAIRIDTGAAAG
jgi:DNA-binding MarR family transcriptional regulator